MAKANILYKNKLHRINTRHEGHSNYQTDIIFIMKSYAHRSEKNTKQNTKTNHCQCNFVSVLWQAVAGLFC